jgi:uncharacterized MAPEG superfamily protein
MSLAVAAALPAAVLLTLGTKLPLAREMAAAKGGYNRVEPRAQIASLTGRGARAAAAHANAWEALLMHGLAALAAMSTGAEGAAVLALLWAWFPLRIAYTGLYISGAGNARSIIWALGMLCSVGVMVLSAATG